MAILTNALMFDDCRTSYHLTAKLTAGREKKCTLFEVTIERKIWPVSGCCYHKITFLLSYAAQYFENTSSIQKWGVSQETKKASPGLVWSHFHSFPLWTYESPCNWENICLLRDSIHVMYNNNNNNKMQQSSARWLFLISSHNV